MSSAELAQRVVKIKQAIDLSTTLPEIDVEMVDQINELAILYKKMQSN